MRPPLAVVLLCAGLLCGAEAAAWAGDNAAAPESPFFFRLDNIQRYFAWGADLVPTGLEVTFGYTGLQLIPGLSTVLQATVEGGYEGLETYRDVDYAPNHQIPPEAAAGHNLHLEFNSPNFLWELGIVEQWGPLELFGFYRGRFERYLKGRHYLGEDPDKVAAIEAYHQLWQANYPGTDAYGLFGTSFLFGVDLDAVKFNTRTKARDGCYLEAAVEASPWFPGVMGATDFWRVSFTAMAFRTLFEARRAADRNRFTIYLGEYFSIDYADAARAMPTYVMQTFGGRHLRYGLGDQSVRGFESHSWDTQLKIVNNLDLRFNLPALVSRDLVPGLLVYFDLGYGRGYWGYTAGAPEARGGFLSSTGLGAYVDVLDFGYVQLGLHFPLIARRLDGSPYELELDFSLQF